MRNVIQNQNTYVYYFVIAIVEIAFLTHVIEQIAMATISGF